MLPSRMTAPTDADVLNMKMKTCKPPSQRKTDKDQKNKKKKKRKTSKS